MSEMIERAARATEIAIVERTAHHPASKYLAEMQWLWPLVARAVIVAMREPTKEMIDEGAGMVPVGQGCEEGPPNLAAARACWQEMIDAALD